MTTPDPLLERLRRLPRPQVDDVTAARTLARAEAAFSSARGAAHAPAGRLAAWWVPAALAVWGILYAGGAVREISRLYPAQAEAKPAVASHHRGSSGFAQFMLNAISKTSARTTAITTIAPPRPPVLGASFTDVSPEMSSDMDPSMTLFVSRYQVANVRRLADRGTIAARTAAQSEPARHRWRATTTTASVSRRNGA